MAQNHIIIDGTRITDVAELESLLEHLHLHAIVPNPDRDYTDISAAFIRRLGEIANAPNPILYLEHSTDNTTSNPRLTFHTLDAFLEVQYLAEGCALIGYCNAFYNSIYYFVNGCANQRGLHPDADSVHTPLERQMLCCDDNTIRDIILYFCRTGREDQNYAWVEDFSYTGPDNWHRNWLKNMLSGHSAPEEHWQALDNLRTAQANGEWQWGTPWSFTESPKEQIRWENPAEMDYLEQLTNTTPPASRELDKHEKLLRRTARKLLKENAFTQRESGVRNLSFLKNCKNLRALDLRCNDIADLTPIASLEDLKELTLDFNLITDLSPLSELAQLRELSLRGNKICSLEPLQNLQNLRDLILTNNPLEPHTLVFLRKCKRLEMLDLAYTGIQDLSDLESCRAWGLTLYGNPHLTGLEVITTMKKLTSLSLDLEVAQQYDIPTLMPRFTEHARYGNHILYVWPEKYFD